MKTRWCGSGGWLTVFAGVVAGLGWSGTASADDRPFTWGHEAAYENRVAVLERPFLTPDPERVEVIWLYWYTGTGFKGTDRSMREWVKSLPDRVDVHRYPLRLLSSRSKAKPYMKLLWEKHQQGLYVARLAGREEAVHRALVEGITPPMAPYSLPRYGESDEDVRRILAENGVSSADIERFYRSPEVGGLKLLAAQFGYGLSSTGVRQGLSRGGSRVRDPLLLINGRYGVAGHYLDRSGRGWRKAFRVANRLIREELERGRAHDGPTNDEAFARAFAPRTGEIVWRQQVKGVFNAWRNEFWMLDDDGEVEHTGRLVGQGDGSTFRLPLPGHVVHVPLWRTALQWRSYERQPRYGAFLLTDWLSAPDTLWVGLPFKGREVAFAFMPDGKVEARNDRGSRFGTWWLEAGNLNVSFGEFGIQSWPWREAAAHVGFEVPQRSMTPWDTGKRKKRRMETTGDKR